MFSLGGMCLRDFDMARMQPPRPAEEGDLDPELWASASLEALREHISHWESFMQDACKEMQAQALELTRRQQLVAEIASDMGGIRDGAFSRIQAERKRLAEEVQQLQQVEQGLRQELAQLGKQGELQNANRDETENRLREALAELEKTQLNLQEALSECGLLRNDNDHLRAELEAFSTPLPASVQHDANSQGEELVAELERSRLLAAALREELAEARLELAREREKSEVPLDFEMETPRRRSEGPDRPAPLRAERAAPARERTVGGSDAVLMSLMQQFEELQQDRKLRR